MYILSSDWDCENNHNGVVDAHRIYEAYLIKNKSNFPESAYEFAIADWHHDYRNHKALHDSWLIDVNIVEEEINGVREVSIVVCLLGAFHNGKLFLRYKNVKSYQLGSSTTGHTSINRDEVRLCNSGNVLHEIEWWQDVRWLIECEDIDVKWTSK